MLALSKSDSSRSSSSLCRGENQTTHSPSTGMQGVISREHCSVSEQSTKDPQKTARHHQPAAEFHGYPPEKRCVVST